MDGLSLSVGLITAFLIGGVTISSWEKDKPPAGFHCTESAIVNGVAECVKYEKKVER